MSVPIILASGSSIRASLLAKVGLQFDVVVPRIDESAIKASLLAEQASPRDLADALAEMKARRISEKKPGAMVIGCDQVLELDGRLLSKPETPDQALEQLREMQGNRHRLLSAAVIVENGQPIWRHVGHVDLRMRMLSDRFLNGYVARNFDGIRDAVGGYKLEQEGAMLFSEIKGDYFTVLGMPLIEVLNFLVTKGVIET